MCKPVGGPKKIKKILKQKNRLVIKKFLKYLRRLLYCVVYSDEKEYKIIKAVAGFFYGVLLGIGLYGVILTDLGFTPEICLAVGAAICLVLGLGNALSIQARCISLLTLPVFCGRVGRGVLRAIVIAFILAGPVQNLASNGREVVRVFSCTVSLTYNLTKTRFELMVLPFAEAVLNLHADVNEVKDTMRSIEGMVRPMVEEFEGEEEMHKIREDNDYMDEIQGDSKREEEIKEKYKQQKNETEDTRYVKRYKRKISSKCEDILSRAASNCRRVFSEAYDKCYSKVSFLAAWLLCWPMKLTFICNVVEAIGGSKTCDASQVLDPMFGAGYDALKRSNGSLKDAFKDVTIQYQIPQAQKLLNVRQVTDSAQDVLTEFERKKQLVVNILFYIKRILAFTFVGVIIGAQKYHDKYLSDIKFDNTYVTQYFRRIDARRRKSKKKTLLPLKKVERAALMDPRAALPGRQELKKLGYQTAKLLLDMITATTLIILDRLLYEALDIIRRHAHVDYTQEGSHDLILKVKGTGMIANMVRSLLGGFNIRQRVKTFYSNEACLPQPTMLPNYYLYKIYGTYLCIFLILFSETYTKRIQRAICAYFYPKREKRRVLFVYNETLRRRKGLFKFMKSKVRRTAREQILEMDANILLVMALRYPKYCGWLKIFPAARRKCLICEEPEPWKPRGEEDFVSCPNPDCYFIYCFQCWKDVEKICYACTPPDDGDEDDDNHHDDDVVDMLL